MILWQLYKSPIFTVEQKSIRGQVADGLQKIAELWQIRNLCWHVIIAGTQALQPNTRFFLACSSVTLFNITSDCNCNLSPVQAVTDPSIKNNTIVASLPKYTKDMNPRLRIFSPPQYNRSPRSILRFH